jgi:RNA polymerase sigma-70 factor (ECF subfamily)
MRSVHRIKPSAADVYEDLSPAVLGYLRGRGARDPEDLTGDVFVKVTEGLGAFRGDRAALRRWVFTIAHNRLVDEFRLARPSVETVSADPPQAATDDEMPLDAEVLEALTTLTEEQREVVVLRFIADVPLKDVARIVGKRLGAVKMLQARGLATLATVLTGDKSD